MSVKCDSLCLFEYFVSQPSAKPNPISLYSAVISSYQSLDNAMPMMKALTKRFDVGNWPIVNAAKHGWVEFLQSVREKCYEVRDADGWNILHYAANEGKVGILNFSKLKKTCL